jgi:uncharacterized membrane protein
MTALLVLAAVYVLVALVRDMVWHDRGGYFGAVFLWPYLVGGVAVCALLRRIPWR